MKYRKSRNEKINFTDRAKRDRNGNCKWFHWIFSNISDFTKIVYTDWTKEGVLAYIASWYISFANNLLAAVINVKATPFKGSLTDVNEREVNRLRIYDISELLEFINNSKDIIEMNIDNIQVKEIAYKKGSRNYSPLEQIEIVSRHINGHLDDLKKKEKENF